MRVAYAAVAVVVVAADQATKWLVVRTMREGESFPVLGGALDIHHVRNPGAAFGLFPGATGFLVLAALIGIAVFTFVIVRRPPPLLGVAAAMVAGGALGNLIDRAVRPWPFRGTVVDFIDLGWWPAFNVADIAVSVGAGLILISGFTAPEGDTERDAPVADRGHGG